MLFSFVQFKTTGEQSTIGSFFGVTGTVSSGSTAQINKHSSKRVQNIVENWRKQKKARRSK
jgi:DNA excision repair protein ERCC-5